MKRDNDDSSSGASDAKKAKSQGHIQSATPDSNGKIENSEYFFLIFYARMLV